MDGLAVKIIHFINDHRSGYDMKLIAADNLPRQVRGGVRDYFKHKVSFVVLYWSVNLSHLIQQLDFDMIQLGGKIHIYLVRVDKTSRFIPERVQLLLTVFPDFHNTGRGVDTFPIQGKREPSVHAWYRYRAPAASFPRLQGIEEEKRLILVKTSSLQGDEIRLDFS